MWSWIASRVLRNRAGILVVLGLITVFMGYMARDVEMSFKFGGLLPKTDSAYIDYQNFLSEFSEDGNVIVLGVQGEKFYTPEVLTLADIERINHLHRRLIFAEFADEHAGIYERYAALYRPRTAEIIEIGRTVTDDERTEALASMTELRADQADLMDAEGIDLWACPAATGPAPAGINATGNPIMNLPWTHAGMPAMTLPAGRAANGLPLGLQLVARFQDDERLLDWGAMLEELL